MSERMIYMDNAATTWPKPNRVVQAVSEAMTKYGGNPGRGGHRLALAAGELLYETRDRVAEFFGCEDAFRVSFTQNITMAINLVLKGFLRPGDHVLVSPMEHNAVMRPLKAMGIRWDVLSANENGRVIVPEIQKQILPETKLIVICHESNVSGVVQPLAEIGRTARDNGIYLLADCAQSAGHLPLDISEDNIDFLCFTGHKGLYGPTGTGGVVFGSRVDVERVAPLVRGGTGSLSESFDQPDFLPDRFESGTQNVCGLAGLNAGIRWIAEQGIDPIRTKGTRQIRMLREGLLKIPGAYVYSGEGQTLSLTMDGVDNGSAGAILDDEYGIMTRIGLHCAPLAHQTLGTFPNGTIRFAVSPFTSDEDIESCIRACGAIAEGLWDGK